MSAIPTSDPLLDAYAFNWKTLLTGAPATWGMLAGDATAISNAYTTFHAQFVLASNPATTTAAIVLAKNIAKAAMLVLLRSQYRIIKANPAVTDANKITLGVVVNDPVPTPIPPPSTFPLAQIYNSAPLQHTIGLADNTTPDSRRKPAGVRGALVFRSVGVNAATDQTQLDFLGLFTRTPFAGDTFDAGDVGKVASYAFRWTNDKGEEGPWSDIYTKTVSN